MVTREILQIARERVISAGHSARSVLLSTDLSIRDPSETAISIYIPEGSARGDETATNATTLTTTLVVDVAFSNLTSYEDSLEGVERLIIFVSTRPDGRQRFLFCSGFEYRNAQVKSSIVSYFSIMFKGEAVLPYGRAMP